MNHPGNPTPTVLEKAYHLAQELDDRIRRGDEPIYIGEHVHEKLRAYRKAKLPDVPEPSPYHAPELWTPAQREKYGAKVAGGLNSSKAQQLAGMGCPDPRTVAEPKGWSKGATPGLVEAPLRSFDARDWARELLRLHSGKTIGKAPDDNCCYFNEADALAWFANALMRGYDEHSWKVQREQAQQAAAPQAQDARISELEARLAGNDQSVSELAQALLLAFQVREGALDAQAQAEKQFFAERQNHERTVAKLTELQKDLAQCQRDLEARDTELSQLRPSAAPQADVLRAAACGLHRVIGCSVCFGRIGQEYR